MLKVPIRTHFFPRAILTRKVGQADLVFGVQSLYISGSVHARLQVSESDCSVYDLCNRICPKLDVYILTSLYPQKEGQTGSDSVSYYTRVRCKFLTIFQ